MSQSWVRKMFRKVFEAPARNRAVASWSKQTRLQFDNLESRLTPSGNAPTATAIPRQTVDESSAAVVLNLGTYFTDPENDPLTFSVVQTNTTGLITPNISGSDLTLNFASGQYGYSYFRVTANDGSNTTTQAFEVIVRNTDNLVADTLSALRSSSTTLNILANDGVGDNIRLASGGNMNVVQNDTGNANTSITLSFPQGTPDLFVNQSPSSRADFYFRVGATATDDVAGGVALTTMRENGRNNNETGNLAGTRYGVAEIESDANGFWVPTQDSARGSEYNFNTAVNYLPYSQGWLGGFTLLPSDNGTTDDSFRSVQPNAGLTIGTAASNTIQDLTTGQYRVAIPGVNSQSDGFVFAVGARNNIPQMVQTKANSDGSWQLYTHLSSVNGAGTTRDRFSFAYVPKGMPNVVSGKIVGNQTTPTVQLQSGNFTITKTGTGLWNLSIPGQSNLTGTLMLSPEGGGTNNLDNFISYKPNANGSFDIQWLDSTGSGANVPVPEDPASGEPAFSFAFVPFLNAPTLRTTSLQSSSNVANQSDLGATLTLNPDGTVNYDPSTSTAVQNLAPGQQIVDTYTYTTTTLDGRTKTTTVTVNVAYALSDIVDLVNGVLTVNSTNGVANNLSVSFDGTNYTITESAPGIPIYLTPAAQAFFSGNGTSSISGPSSAVSSISISTGDLDDTVNLNSLDDPFTINGGGNSGDTVNVGGTLTFSGDASINGVATVTATTGAKIVTTTGSVTLSASNSVGTLANPVLTQAGTLNLTAGAGGIFLTEDDGATLTASTTGGGSINVTNTAGTLNATATSDTGNINLTNTAGTLNIAGPTSTSSGWITLISGDAVTLNANLSTGTAQPAVVGGAITINANTDNAGSQGFDQGLSTIATNNTGSTALSITVGGTGDAIVGVGTIGNAIGGTANVTATGGNILWSSLYTLPDIATSNGNTLRADAYVFTAGPNSSIGTLASPIQSDNFADFTPATLAAGTGGVYWTDWGSPDMQFSSVTAQGAGNIQLIAANAGGHNLSILNAQTGSGNITLIADDDLFVGTLNNAATLLPGTIGGPSFTGTISLLANRDRGNEQRIIMRPGSVIQTANTSSNAILLRSFASDNSATDSSIGGVTLTSVIAGDGGTITVDVASIDSATGSIIQQDNTTVGLDAGPSGTVILNARNILNGTNPANLAAIGDAISPIRIRAGTINVTSVNTPIRLAPTIASTVTATVTASGTPIVANAGINITSESGVLTIGGATNTDGGTVTVSSAAGVIVNGVLSDSNTGNLIIDAAAADVAINSTLTVVAGQTATINDGNSAQLNSVVNNGTISAANGISIASGQTFSGTGTVSGAVTIPSGAIVAPGTGAGTLTTGPLTLAGTYNAELNGAVAGTNYDQINVGGSVVDLTGSTLNVLLGYLPALNDSFTIVKNYSTLTGVFSNTFPLSVGSAVFSINYTGGPTNNDVVLTVANLRPSATFAAVVPNPRDVAVTSENITFSEPVVGFDVSDLSLTLNNVSVPLTGVTISGAGPTYTINGLGALTGAAGNYVLTLTAAGSGIQDLNVPAGTIFANSSVAWLRSNNTAPVLDNTGDMKLDDILENALTNNGTLISTLITSAGTRITDINSDPLGIAVTAVDTTNGNWQYSTNNGSSWTSFAAPSQTTATLLAADGSTRVRFVPNTDFYGKVPTGLTFRAWDQTTGVNGGTADVTSNGSSTSYSTATETASIFVMYVPKAITTSFQQGVNGYTGAQDTRIGEDVPDDTTQGTTDPTGGLLVDYTSTTSGLTSQVLLRFDNLFGNGPGQIPLGATIVSALLTVSTNNSGAGGAFYRMKQTWDQSVDTWNTLGDGQNGHNSSVGIQADGVEASNSYVSFAGPPGVNQATGSGFTQFGVTPDIQAWANGEANNGWAILPWSGGSDGWAFHSSEADSETDRPALQITYLPPGSSVGVATNRQGLNGYTGTVDTEIRQDQPNTNRDLAGETFVDYDDGNLNQTEALLRFNNLVGNSPTSIPAGASVIASTLHLVSTGGSSPGDGGTFNRMLIDWNASDTWNTFGNGVSGRNAAAGIQADGSEASAAYNFQAGVPTRSPLAQATVFPFNATEDVQAWVNGAANYGWAGLPWNGGSNGWSFNQSEVADPNQRPTLVTYYAQPEHEHSQIDVTNSELSFLAGGGANGLGIDNNLTISLAGGFYTFTDPTDVIILTPGALAAGWTGSGTNTVTGPSSNVNSLTVNTGLGSDTVTLAGGDDPVSINGGNTGTDVLNLSGNVTASGGTVSLYGFNSINHTGGVIDVGAGTIYFAAPNVGSSGNRVLTAAGSIFVQGITGGSFITDADSVTIGSATATGAGTLDFSTATGSLTVGGPLTTETGNVTLSAAGNAILGSASVGGSLTVTGGNILWGGTVDPVGANNPVGGNEPTAVLVANGYTLTATSPTGSIGTATTPIQTDNPTGASATLTAGSGGIYLSDWGSAALTVANATATGAGDVVLVSGNAGGHNLNVTNVTTQTGNIFLAADDTLNINGAIGGAGFSGTVTLIANRDNANEQRIVMSAASSITTTNATANAVLFSVNATDTNPANNTLGGVTLSQVTVGNGGTITVNGSADSGKQGNILMVNTTATLDAGASGTVVLYAANLQNGTDPAGGANIGTSATPIRVHAGTVSISAENTPVNVKSTTAANFTAALTAVGANTSLPGGTLTLSTEAGALTIAGATSTAGGTITLNGAGVVLGAQLGNGTETAISITGDLSGSGAISAGTGLVTLTQSGNSTYSGVISGDSSVTKAGAGALSLTAANLYTGGTTVTLGTLAINNTSDSGTGTGAVIVNGGTLAGVGTISGTVTVNSGVASPGNSPGTLAIGSDLNLSSAAHYNVELATPTSYDSLAVTGNVNLNSDANVPGGATLDIVAANPAVVSGTIFTIVTGATVTGTLRNFDGTNLTDGTSFVTAGGVGLTIHYTSTTVTLTVNAPTVTGIVPFSGPTTGGQTVIITGTNFGAVSGAGGVQFGLGSNAASYIILSNTSIQAVTPAHAAGTVDVLVTNNSQKSAVNAGDHYTFDAATAPTFDQFTVNGGDIFTVDAFGQKPTDLVGNNSIVEQLYVTFSIGVTLAPGAFRLDAGTVAESISSNTSPVTADTDVLGIIAEADTSTLDSNGGYKGYRLRFDSTVSPAHPNAANYVNILDNTFAAGNISTSLKDGYYKLNTIGANVHAGNSVAGTAMASNNVQGVWTLFGSVDPASFSPTTNNSNDNTSFATIGQPDLDAMLATVGSSREFANPPYNANLDFDLSGDITQVDLDAFLARFGSEWVF